MISVDQINTTAEYILLTTAGLWALLEFALLIFRVVVKREPTPGGKVLLISNTVRKRASQWNWIPWVWGVLGGHFFGPSGTRSDLTNTALITLTVAVLTGDALLHTKYYAYLDPQDQPKWLRILRNRWFVFLAAIATGALLWAQA